VAAAGRPADVAAVADVGAEAGVVAAADVEDAVAGATNAPLAVSRRR
jgi:hypothetical protein